jgi:hypothetical protein
MKLSIRSTPRPYSKHALDNLGIPPKQPYKSSEEMKMEQSTWWYDWFKPFLGDINTRTWPSRLGVSRNSREKNTVMSPEGLGPENEQQL